MLNPEDKSVNTGLEPELGGIWRDNPDRSGLEPELGGEIRQKGVYVDEVICIGCKNCVHVASNTFYLEPEYGRARVFNQNGNSEALVQEAIDTCPVNCIDWLDYTELKQKEAERKNQKVRLLGFPQTRKLSRAKQRRMKNEE
jgi:ferredoxin